MSSKTLTASDIPPAAHPASPLRARRLYPALYAAAAYAALVALTIHHHEPWADEAQSWLLARDASLVHLWGHLLHYEGSPGLWQTCLHALIGLGLGYSAYNFVSGVLGLTAAYLLMRYAPLPLFIRILLPFTYYLCYQYAVIARSYALFAPLLFALALIYPEASRKLVLTTTLACLLAGVSAQGLLISACLWVTLGARILLAKPNSPTERRAFAIATAIYGAVLTFFAVCAWPASDVAFAEHRGLSNLHLLPLVTKTAFGEAFAGDWRIAFAVVALSLPFLWRGGGLLFFALSSAAFCLFETIVYVQLWHFGVLFLVWLFAIWISAYQTRVTVPTLLALLTAIGFQCYWTAAAVRYDWSHPYSGSLSASQNLKPILGPAGPPGGLYAIGYPTAAIQPYFPANIYSNFGGGSPRAYWDWSKQNSANDPSALFASQRRELVLVGFKNSLEKQTWASILDVLGYRAIQHFDGATFWRTGIFELESYDLYRQTSAPRATGSLAMGDPARAPQLLNGFYDIEGGKSRWTARNFSVLLKAPPVPRASLHLKLYVPAVSLARLGPITIGAEIGGHELPGMILSQSMEYDYQAEVLPAALKSGFVAVNFHLNKSSTGLNGDARDLGVIVTEVGLFPPSSLAQ